MQSTHLLTPIVVQIVGYKNTGKTTLVCRLTERFKQAGYKVGTIKRDAHDFQMDTPGTDTWKHQAAGAEMTAITSSKRTAILKQHTESLDRLIEQMKECDVILIEGFKTAAYPKIIMIRTAADLELLQQATNALAAAAWSEADFRTDPSFATPVFDINQIDQLFQKVLSLSKSGDQSR
ncbi:molybdopterin-guanine dinucleotide biosynthesis protein B [Paenibacillus alkaliterrae]|uniref:molybdopterin-guanine dinucleotide biosynthesis protein B n=1 Tax=Paenibacillus alkaliterrae TaxID=320909 RepID=UPI001F18BBBA|nr:molybdopterin-guanine dinucleotide biosynthesis protein B [Paenibacillus alkaliterrae]MCF2941287.1 molybdopterin-guanine dinucleotide biosynthesis protein B [Paenibacillus alkaliterrae]